MNHGIKGLVAANLAVMLGFANMGSALADTVLRFATGTPGGDTANNDSFLDWAAMVNMKFHHK